jgi:hypothetical protein
VERAPGVEVLLDGRQQVLLALGGDLPKVCNPGMRERLVGGHAGGGVNGEAATDELACFEGDAPPIFERREGVVGDEDGLHLLEVGVAVEGSVAAEEEVGYDADGPYVAAIC